MTGTPLAAIIVGAFAALYLVAFAITLWRDPAVRVVRRANKIATSDPANPGVGDGCDPAPCAALPGARGAGRGAFSNVVVSTRQPEPERDPWVPDTPVGRARVRDDRLDDAALGTFGGDA